MKRTLLKSIGLILVVGLPFANVTAAEQSGVRGWITHQTENRPNFPHSYVKPTGQSVHTQNGLMTFESEEELAKKHIPIGGAPLSWSLTVSEQDEYVAEAVCSPSNGILWRIGIYTQLGNRVPYYWTGEGYGAFSGADAFAAAEDRTRSVICNSQKGFRIYIATNVLVKSEVRISMLGGKTVDFPFERCIFLFIDDHPAANWAHPCRYVFFNETLTDFVVSYQMYAPCVRHRMTGEYVGLKRTDVAEESVSLKAVTDNVYDSVRKMSANSMTYSGDTSKSYFVLVSGGGDPANNGIRFWADTAMMYATLTKKYKVPKPNIKVYISDGTSTSNDANLDSWNNRVLVSSPTDLDGDGDGDVTGAATKSNLQSAFDTLKNQLTASDQLFVFVTSHGEADGTRGVNNRDCIAYLYSANGDEKFRDDELASWTSGFSCPVAFAIETCFSGGFVDDIIATPKRVIATACDHYESSFGWSGGGRWGSGGKGQTIAYNAWIMPFIGALRGFVPKSAEAQNCYPWADGSSVNADANEDGLVSFTEAKTYATLNDEYLCRRSTHGAACHPDDPDDQTSEHPQYGESSSGLGNSFFIVKKNDVPLPDVINLSVSLGSSAGSVTTASFTPTFSSSWKMDCSQIPSWISRIVINLPDGNMAPDFTPGQGSVGLQWVGAASFTVYATENPDTSARTWTWNLKDKNGNAVCALKVTQAGRTVGTTFTVTFNANGGSCSTSTKQYSSGATLGTLPTATWSGNTFEGWYTSSSGGTKVTASTVVTGDMTLYAHWTLNPTSAYTVTYAPGNYGTGTSSTATKTQGVALTLKGVTFTRTGYTQTGWSLGVSGGTMYYGLGASYTTDAAVTLYPYWTANTYSVTYALNGGSHGATHPTSATYDTAFQVSAPTRSGYTFAGWTVTSGLNTSTAKWGTGSSPSTAISSSTTKCGPGAVYFKNLTPTAGATVTLTANWTAIPTPTTYTVTYAPGTYGTGSSSTATKTAGVALTLKGATFTRTGYAQTGWSKNTSGSTKDYNLSASYTTDAAVTLYPHWTANTYSVAYALNGGSHGATHPTSATYDTAFQVSAPTRSGYTFTGWTVTSGLNTSTAKWGTTSSPSTAISSSTAKCGPGNVYFKNLAPTAGAAVTLTANWTENPSALPDLSLGWQRVGWPQSPFLSDSPANSNVVHRFEVGCPIYLFLLVKNEGVVDVTGEYDILHEVLNDDGVCIASYLGIDEDLWAGYSIRWEGSRFSFLQGLAPGEYTYRCTVDSRGRIAESDENNNVASVAFTVIGGAVEPPEKPSIRVPTWGTNTADVSYITISWTGGNGATSFNLYRSATTSRPSSPFATNVTSPYNDYKSTSGLTPGVKYYYWVEAVNSSGTTYSDPDWGNILVTLSLGKATDSYAVSGGTGSVSVSANTSWSASTEVGWITFGTKSGSGSGTLTYTVAKNATTASRTGTITVTAGSGTAYPKTALITVTQDSAPVTTTYTVTYAPGNYGTGTSSTATKTQGVALTLKGATFTRTGYAQTGWSKNSSGSTKDYNLSASYTTDAAVTLYPYWTANAYSVAYALNGGTHGATHPASATYDTAFQVSAPTRSGYTFAGWTVTGGLNTSTAKWGTGSSPSTAISSSTTKCGPGNVYFKNLTPTAGATVTLTANWTANPTPPTYGPWGEAEAVKNPDKLGPTMLTDMTLELNGATGAVGDVVAAFRDDTGALCGLGKVMDGSGTLSMACYAPTGVKLHFKVWVAASGVEEPVVVDCDAKSDLAAPTSGAFLSGHALVVSDDKDLTISLGSADWHTVSFNVLPEDSSPAAVFGSVKAKIAAVTQGIEFWMPGKSSSLKAIEIGKGYWVNTKVDDVEWTVSGKTDPKVEIALEEGWNLVGYAPEAEGAVQQVLKTALAAKAVDYVTYGVEFYPGGTLKKMEPGKAYWVHATKAYTLVYDDGAALKAARTLLLRSAGAAVPTYGPWGESEAVKNPDKLGPTFLTDMAVEVDGEPAEYGDVVAVFRGDTGALCGLGKVMDDSGTLTVVCYAQKGVTLSFKVWLAESGVEEAVVVKCDNASKLVAPESGAFYDGHAISGSTAVWAETVIAGEKVTIETELFGYKAMGLPSGLKYDAKTGKITGAAKAATAAEGVVVKFTKNGAEDEELTIVVRAEEISAGCEGLSSGPLPAGVAGATGGMDIQIDSEGGTKSVSVTKLPSGMKYDSKSGKITGVPTKAGDSEVVLTVTTKYGNKKTEKILVSVAAIPVMAVGKFDGFVSVGRDDFGTFTLTTTDAGKLTAKVITAAGTVSFSGTCWDSAADGVYRATLTTKKGETLTLTLDSTAAWDANQLSGEFTTALIPAKGKSAEIPSRTYTVSAQRNAFGKTWYFAADGNESEGWTFAYTEDAKSAALTVTLKADGSTSIAGKLPNGTDANGKQVTFSVSASGYANVGGLTAGAIMADFAPVLTVNKVKTVLAITTNLWFDRKNEVGRSVGAARFVK